MKSRFFGGVKEIGKNFWKYVALVTNLELNAQINENTNKSDIIAANQTQHGVIATY